MRPLSLPQTVALLQGQALRQIPKLSSIGWWYFLLTIRLLIDLRTGGQLPQVISFEALFLFVMSGAGFTPSNSNAETSDASIIEERTDRYQRG